MHSFLFVVLEFFFSNFIFLNNYLVIFLRKTQGDILFWWKDSKFVAQLLWWGHGETLVIWKWKHPVSNLTGEYPIYSKRNIRIRKKTGILIGSITVPSDVVGWGEWSCTSIQFGGFLHFAMWLDDHLYLAMWLAVLLYLVMWLAALLYLAMWLVVLLYLAMWLAVLLYLAMWLVEANGAVPPTSPVHSSWDTAASPDSPPSE